MHDFFPQRVARRVHIAPLRLLTAVTTLQVSPGDWRIAHELPEDFKTGYGYAIATGSSTLLSVYQQRCKKAVLHKQLPRNTDCSFTIDYDGTSHVSAAVDAIATLKKESEEWMVERR
jgi:hypothetical protein